MTFGSLSLSPQLLHHQAILDYLRLSLVPPFLHYAKQPDLQWETRSSSITHYLVSPWSPTAQTDYLEMRLYQPWSSGELGLGSEIGTCNYSVGFSNVQAHPKFPYREAVQASDPHPHRGTSTSQLSSSASAHAPQLLPSTFPLSIEFAGLELFITPNFLDRSTMSQIRCRQSSLSSTCPPV